MKNANGIWKPEEDVKIVHAELMPSVDSILRPGVDRAILARIVEHKVAEIVADKEALAMEPFFRSRQIAYEIRRLQTVPEQQSWRVFYDRHSCLYCHNNERIHGGCGCCVRCYPRILTEKQAIIKELMNGKR